MDESTAPGAKQTNIDISDFSDVKNQLVALPKSFDCCFKARDEVWLDKTLAEEKR
jgi:hypothetical protein